MGWYYQERNHENTQMIFIHQLFHVNIFVLVIIMRLNTIIRTIATISKAILERPSPQDFWPNNIELIFEPLEVTPQEYLEFIPFHLCTSLSYDYPNLYHAMAAIPSPTPEEYNPNPKHPSSHCTMHQLSIQVPSNAASLFGSYSLLADKVQKISFFRNLLNNRNHLTWWHLCLSIEH